MVSILATNYALVCVGTFIYLLRRFVSENDDRAVVYPRDDVRLVHLLVRYNVNINTRQQITFKIR